MREGDIKIYLLGTWLKNQFNNALYRIISRGIILSDIKLLISQVELESRLISIDFQLHIHIPLTMAKLRVLTINIYRYYTICLQITKSWCTVVNSSGHKVILLVCVCSLNVLWILGLIVAFGLGQQLIFKSNGERLALNSCLSNMCDQLNIKWTVCLKIIKVTRLLF